MKNLTRRQAVKTGAAIAAVGATATLGLPSVAEAEPLVAMLAERNKWLALANIAGNKAERCNDVHELECYALSDKAYDIEHQIADATAKTLTGVLVQIRVHNDAVGDSIWRHGDALMRNVVKALERMEGAAVVGM